MTEEYDNPKRPRDNKKAACDKRLSPDDVTATL